MSGNERFASDEYELAAMDLMDEVYRHPLRRAGDAGAVLVSEHLHMCLEVFKRENGPEEIEPGHTIETIHGLPCAVYPDYEDTEWYVIDRIAWDAAVSSGEVSRREVWGGETETAYLAGPVECFSCGHEWVATRPADTDVLECPECGEMMGASLA